MKRIRAILHEKVFGSWRVRTKTGVLKYRSLPLGEWRKVTRREQIALQTFHVGYPILSPFRSDSSFDFVISEKFFIRKMDSPIIQ